MKTTMFAAIAVGLCAPVCSYAAPSPTVASGALLSTNLSAAVLRLDNAMGVGANGLYSSGATPSGLTAAFDPGGDGGSDPVHGLPISGSGCATSPENGTALLAILGFMGLLAGRFSYNRKTRSQAVAAA